MPNALSINLPLAVFFLIVDNLPYLVFVSNIESIYSSKDNHAAALNPALPSPFNCPGTLLNCLLEIAYRRAFPFSDNQ